ncbi:MAG: Ppx/GppA family phosphatase [Bacteroidales bacterium]
MKLLKFAAIDIGSNAVRLLFMNVVEDKGKTTFKKSSLVRVPVRLGDDAFVNGKISLPKQEKLTKTMVAFKNLMDVHEVISYRACATSAMREASNGNEVVGVIKKNSGIDIEIIEGKQEAEIIYSTQIVEMINDSNHYLYVDVGGGSTEITHFFRKELVQSQTFNIGTIRLLSQNVTKEQFKDMGKWLKTLKTNGKEITLIGSGGNINKLIKLVGAKNRQQITFDELNSIRKKLKRYTVNQRIRIFGLNLDRADVIVPASDIFVKIMKWTKAHRIIVPTIGVSDGIVHQLYNEYRKSRKQF